MPGRMEFDFSFPRAGSGRPRDDGDPMRLLVIGDFSGTSTADRPPLAPRSTRPIDIDTFDDVMHRLAPRVRVGTSEIAFQELDDFHPDRLYARLDLFGALREARTKPPTTADDDALGRRREKAAAPNAAPATPAASPIDALIRG